MAEFVRERCGNCALSAGELESTTVCLEAPVARSVGVDDWCSRWKPRTCRECENLACSAVGAPVYAENLSCTEGRAHTYADPCAGESPRDCQPPVDCSAWERQSRTVTVVAEKE